MLLLLIKFLFICSYSDPTPAGIIAYVNGVEQLAGDNFTKWSREINLILLMMDKDHSMRDNAPVALVAQWIHPLLSALLLMRRRNTTGSTLIGWL